MRVLFESYRLGPLQLPNRFVFPPVKTGYGDPSGAVTERQLVFYRRIAQNGPGIVILEPVSVTADGLEHPKQLRVHLPESAAELAKIARVVHEEGRLACLHLNHGGAAANPMLIGGPPKAPGEIDCVARGGLARALNGEEIDAIVEGYKKAARKASEAGFDLLEIQAGHGYLISQFLNGRINRRDDDYGRNRALFAQKVFEAVREGAPDMPFMVRVSGDEMSPQFGIERSDLAPLLKLAESRKAVAVHAGMGNACFSPPWYFHHGSLPEKPQTDALAWLRGQTDLPLIAAGRLGRIEKIERMLERNLLDLAALGRPLIADPDLLEKWRNGRAESARACGYCLQGCLHRLKNKQPLGCNVNPELGNEDPGTSPKPLNVLVAGGGPAGLAATVYLGRRGHKVTLAEKRDRLGGQFELAWRAPGKAEMKQGLDWFKNEAEKTAESVLLNTEVDADLVEKSGADLLVWAAGGVPFVPEIEGLGSQNAMTAVEFFKDPAKVAGPRVLVVGAGRSGLEIAEKLGSDRFQVTATKRTDPIGSMMEAITRKLALARIERMENVSLMPRTTVKAFLPDGVLIECDGAEEKLEPFQTVVLASGMVPAPGPGEDIRKKAVHLEIIGDARGVEDIFSAVHAGYDLALKF